MVHRAADRPECWDFGIMCGNANELTKRAIDDNAKLVERVSYDAYGDARHHRMGDLNGDGAVDISDQLLLFGAWGDGGVGDLNRDGASDVSDLLLLQGSWGPAIPAGRISAGSSGTDNIIGYVGYVFNPEMHGSGLYTVRYRVYDPELSRWLTRDPIGYVDGMSLYEYVRSSPIQGLDPMGLVDIIGPGGTSLDVWPVYPTKSKEDQFLDWYNREIRDMEWLDDLPSCPCRLQQSSQPSLVDRPGPGGGYPRVRRPRWIAPPGWSLDSPLTVPRYHPGAESCIRSRPVDGSAQQCCYDRNGKLITSGGGAGTPDKGPGGTPRHYREDVLPFNLADDLDKGRGGSLYRRLYCEVRPPNNGNNCPDNPSPW